MMQCQRLNRVSKNEKINSTSMNEVSRSHLIFTIIIQTLKTLRQNKELRARSLLLTLLDSERYDKHSATPERVKRRNKN
jgi:hypothetical protein